MSEKYPKILHSFDQLATEIDLNTLAPNIPQAHSLEAKSLSAAAVGDSDQKNIPDSIIESYEVDEFEPTSIQKLMNTPEGRVLLCDELEKEFVAPVVKIGFVKGFASLEEFAEADQFAKKACERINELRALLSSVADKKSITNREIMEVTILFVRLDELVEFIQATTDQYESKNKNVTSGQDQETTQTQLQSELVQTTDARIDTSVPRAEESKSVTSSKTFTLSEDQIDEKLSNLEEPNLTAILKADFSHFYNDAPEGKKRSTMTLRLTNAITDALGKTMPVGARKVEAENLFNKFINQTVDDYYSRVHERHTLISVPEKERTEEQRSKIIECNADIEEKKNEILKAARKAVHAAYQIGLVSKITHGKKKRNKMPENTPELDQKFDVLGILDNL